jgi:hypothetical protein
MHQVRAHSPVTERALLNASSDTEAVMRRHGLLLSLSFAIVGCASTPGARPEEMSAAEHEQAARQHAGEAAAIEAGCNNLNAGICWTSVGHPTTETQQRAEKHRRMAADHRAASQALRDAEASACAGIPNRDRDESPFLHREDIVDVAPLYASVSSKSGGQRLIGATVRFHAVPGMTAEWLQRIVECHMARNAAMGYAMPEMNECPLMIKGATATVTSTGNGFAVNVRSEDIEAATDIRRRAEALTPRQHL